MWGSLQGQAAGFDCKAFLDQGRTRTSSRGSRSKLQPGKQKVEVHWCTPFSVLGIVINCDHHRWVFWLAG